MTQKEEALKKLEELKLEFHQKSRELEEIIKKEESGDVVWKPAKDSDIYFIDVSGAIESDVYNKSYDFQYTLGDIYSSYEEAKNARDARIILTDLQRMADEANGKKIRANNANSGLYYIVYRRNSILTRAFVTIMCDSKGLFIGLTYGIGFKTKESAQQTLDTLVLKYGEDKVMMAFSGVWR